MIFQEEKNLNQIWKQQSNELQNIFQVRGFPTVWIFPVLQKLKNKFSINANLSNPFQKMGYMGSAKDFISKADYIIENE